MANTKSELLCLSITGFRKPDLDHAEYRRYMTEVHGPLVRDVMLKHGIVHYTMTHNAPETRSLMSRLFDTQFAIVSEYDCVIQIVFKKVDDFEALKADLFFIKNVAPDHENFADTKRSSMSIGYYHEVLRENKTVEAI